MHPSDKNRTKIISASCHRELVLRRGKRVASWVTYLKSSLIDLLLVQDCVHVVFHLEVGLAKILILLLQLRHLRVVIALVLLVKEAVSAVQFFDLKEENKCGEHSRTMDFCDQIKDGHI